MTLHKVIFRVFVYIWIILNVMSVVHIKTFTVELETFSYHIKVKHSIFDQLEYETYIYYIENHYKNLNIEIEDVILFQFVKPKGFNNQQLSLKYGAVLEDRMIYGTLYIEVESIFSFAYSKSGSIISSIVFVVFLIGLNLVKIIIKKR
jgi:hypothetical protein